MPNYYTHTTSEVEYWFVADASPKKLEELRREGALEVLNISDWPTEQRFTSSTLDTSQPSEVLGSRSAKRFPQSLSDFESDLNERNALLKEKSLEPIVEAELIGARLYTGPMYCKVRGAAPPLSAAPPSAVPALVAEPHCGVLVRHSTTRCCATLES